MISIVTFSRQGRSEVSSDVVLISTLDDTLLFHDTSIIFEMAFVTVSVTD